MLKNRPCLHCLQKLLPNQQDFCCLGCKAAYQIIQKNGFANFYQIRQESTKFNENSDLVDSRIGQDVGNRPEEIKDFAIKDFAKITENGYELSVLIAGMHCAACVWLIENLLKKQSSVESARINLSQKTLNLRWQGDLEVGNDLLRLVSKIGYKILPFDLKKLNYESSKEEVRLTKALAVAGFGAGNLMLFSLSLWFADSSQMGFATRQFLHFFSSLLALPVVIYSGRIFFISAMKAIKNCAANMDLAISVAIILSCLASSLQNFAGGEYVYFDSAVMLVFFLLIGRWLDFKARKKAFDIATEFSLLSASFGRVLGENGKIEILPAEKLQPKMILLVAVGEKIAADALVIEGESDIDNSIVNGESLPKKISAGSQVFAGAINLSSPIKLEITSFYHQTFLFQASKIIADGDKKKSRYVQIADRWSKIYLPVVHLLAVLTFIFWFLLKNSGFEIALMNSVAVLIITCPCALALAVPIVQTIAIGTMIKRGILVKNGEIFEKLPQAKFIIFDKTGTLTEGAPRLFTAMKFQNDCVKKLSSEERDKIIEIVAQLANQSCHPLSLAIVDWAKNLKNSETELNSTEIEEVQGRGLKGKINQREIFLGRSDFCRISTDFLELLKSADFLQQNGSGEVFENSHFLRCFIRYGDQQLALFFTDTLKKDAFEVVKNLQNQARKVILLSGDDKNVVKNLAQKLGIKEFYGEVDLARKAEFVRGIKEKLPASEKLLMIGDGINDAPALAIADISISFSKAADITQNIADIVISKNSLGPILECFWLSKFNLKLMKQNLVISLIYNLFAVPLAIMGKVVPLIAALAMSSSSLLVFFNSLRARKFKQ